MRSNEKELHQPKKNKKRATKMFGSNGTLLEILFLFVNFVHEHESKGSGLAKMRLMD